MARPSYDKLTDALMRQKDRICRIYDEENGVGTLENEYAHYDIMRAYDPYYDKYLNRSMDYRIQRGEYSKELSSHETKMNNLHNSEKKGSVKTKEKAKKRKHTNIVALLFVVGVLIGIAYTALQCFASIERYTTYNRFTKYRGEINLARAVEPAAYELISEKEEDKKYGAMVVYEAQSGRVLYEYKKDNELPMASTTKIMTAIIAIENISELDKKVKIPKEAVGIVGSSIYLRENEELTARELLYGLMLASGNDSATALAILSAGSEESFVKLMNQKATELGLLHTNFVTTHGLHDDNHYTSAYDLAKITAYAMGNSTFAEIVSTKRKTIPNETEKEPRYLKNKQKLMFEDKFEEEGIIIDGVKSGFTPEAGRCLVTSAKLNNMEIYIVVLNCPEIFKETEKLIDEAKKNYKMEQVLPPYNHISKIMVTNGFSNSINICTIDGFEYPLTEIDKAKLKVLYKYDDIVSAPIEKNQELGVAEVKLDTEKLFETPIISIESSRSNKAKDIIREIIKDAI